MEKVHFTEEQSTMLATLYGRAMDNRLAHPILGDPTAEDTVRKIDYDFGKFRMNRDQALSVAMRARVFDDWAGDFLHREPDATVLHLGCGMDSRVYRIDPPPTVRWYDVDYPETIDVRGRLYPERPGYHTIGSSVTDLTWVDQVPATGPVLVVAEGLTMYLDPAGGKALLSKLIEHFGSGEMMFDTYSNAGIKLQKLNPVVRRAGATLSWGVDGPHELAELGLKLVERLGGADFADQAGAGQLSVTARTQLKLLRWIPPLRDMGQLLHYRF
ncbi:class I SAM-dependent methyltransferase [Amycolatopsis nigrescens]|uniref:class I SAM-dependent methyltransferase n=1 Tax=Amycolatopsis nigrescens TaxID=381445 RepID=UPI000364FF9D|nr:class I SAM-dependent methyltransferase [Amycolatopsis nigrescens]